jgi:E3 ubiquitin-protein ligase UBR7
MFQCLGLGTVETGGCGEDWYHPECLMGLPRHWHESQDSKEGNHTAESITVEQPQEEDEDSHPVPPGFPGEDDFEALVCYKCVESNPWIKKYGGTPGFLPPVMRQDEPGVALPVSALDEPVPKDNVASIGAGNSLKRKASGSELDERPLSPTKRVKEADDDAPVHDQHKLSAVESPDTVSAVNEPDSKPQPKHALLPNSGPFGKFSLFLQPDFREYFCHCPSCFPNLIPHPQLLEDEDTYEPSLSSDGSSQHHGNGTNGSSRASLLERGEAALSNIDRVRAIEGVMVYNHLRDKVKEFLKPYAEDGRVVSAEDIKSYFEKLRGDEKGIREARDDAGGTEEDNRKEQSGY